MWVRVARRRNTNSSRAKVATLKARAEKLAQSPPTSRSCSSVPQRKGDPAARRQEKIISKAAAGIEQLVNQFAKGDRHARRDLLTLAETLGIDLAPGQGADLDRPLRRRSPPMMKRCWPITCGVSVQPKPQVRSRRTTIPVKTLGKDSEPARNP